MSASRPLTEAFDLQFVSMTHEVDRYPWQYRLAAKSSRLKRRLFPESATRRARVSRWGLASAQLPSPS